MKESHKEDYRHGGHGTLPEPRTVGEDTKPAERPGVPAQHVEHGHKPAPHSPGRRTNPTYGRRQGR